MLLGGIGLAKSIRLQTRLGREIENHQDPEYTVHQRRMEEGKLLDVFRLVISRSEKRREASNLYNCHGMTFALRRTGITEERWVKLILVDDGYQEIDLHSTLPGDVVLYFEGKDLAHTGMVVGVDRLGTVPVVKVLSKWGRGGEFIHDLEVHPYHEVTEIRFYRDQSDAS